jgi:Mg-chelatase subunit ChlD
VNIPDITFIRPGAWWFLLLVPIVVGGGLLLGRQRKSRLLALMRTATLVLLVFTLTGPMLVQGARNTTTVFVVDRSESIQPGSAEAANAWITEALSQAGTGDDAAIVTFGAEPDLAAAPTSANEIGDGWLDTASQGEATDLSSALSLARSLPVGDNRRIVVLSDGEETIGTALEQADQAQQDGVVIDVVPLSGIDTGDMRVERLGGPETTWQGEDIPLLLQVGAGGGGSATVELLLDGVVIGTSPVTLQPGSTIVQLSVPAPTPGFHAIEVRVQGSSDIDRIPLNNSGYLGVIVRDQPQVLLVAPVGSDPARLQQAFEAEGAKVTVVAPDDVPFRTSDLAGYDAVVLNNVPAWNLSNEQQSTIVAHTQSGNGLTVIGGSASYGPGSYAGTPLEAAMPVTVKVVDGQQRPSVAVLIIMDKSGSMSYDPQAGSTSKIDLAKNGVVTAASALAPGDQLGVIAFNDEPIWALPMMTITGQGDLGKVEDSLAALSADGGTELYPALQVGYDHLRNVDADVRHIILLSDGKSRSGTRETYARLVSDLGGDNITLSTVALGTDADLDLLEFLATTGSGRYHYANSPEEIPQITFEEAQNAGSQSVLRGAFGPVQNQASPILNNIDVSAMPAIDGYNFAEGRAEAQVDLVSDRGDPLLAKWQLGLGRVVAWTADDGSDYANEWSTWGQYDQFWGSTMRWTLPDPTNQAITATMERTGTGARIEVDSQLSDGESVNLAGSTVELTAPDGTTHSVPLQALQPGLYDGSVELSASGSYLLSIPDHDAAMATSLQVAPEWLPTGDGLSLLTSLANRTSGNVLSLDESPGGDLFSNANVDGRSPGDVRSIWGYPLALALGLFVAEIALRQMRQWSSQSPDGSEDVTSGPPP